MTSGHADTSKLNPLTPHARGELERVAREPVPTLELNAGVMDRFLRGRLVEIVQRRSPFKSHNGRDLAHAKITDAGLVELGLPVFKPKRKR